MKIILFTAKKCPKCPAVRKLLREVAKELNLVEGKDFVEKIIDGANLQPGEMDIEGTKYYIVKETSEISEDKLPAAIAGDFMIEALTFQIASTPSIVINNEPIFISQIPSKEELIKEIKKGQ